MVSLTLFSIVMTTSVGSLLSLIDANAKAQALYSAMTNLSFALDSIGRNIRTGYSYYCSNSLPNTGSLPTTNLDCPSGQSGIAFTREKDGVRVGYRYAQVSGKGFIEAKEGNGNWVKLTSDDVVIEKFELKLTGSDGLYDHNDIVQPRVLIEIKGYVNNGLDTNTKFALQTHVTQRILNYYSN